MSEFKKLGPNDPNPFDEKNDRKNWWNDEKKAREAAAQFGMTPEEMNEAGMYPDGTPHDSGPADFADAVNALADDSPDMSR